MNIQPPDYDRIEQELWEKYKNEVRDQLKKQNPGLLLRIRKFSDRFGFDEIEIRQKIKSDLMFACCFTKNPTRTGFHEKEAGEYLQQFPKLIRSFEFLKALGKNAKYMDQNGKIVLGKQPPNGSKSLDFIWTAGDTCITCFGAHKFTREKGGSQNHQRDELMRLLQIFKNCDNKNIAPFAICDGPYYNEKVLFDFRQHVRTEPPYSFAGPIDDVPKNVEKILKDYEK